MYILGVTGSAGTGKTTVASMLAKKGALVIDADKVVHQLLKPREVCFSKVVRHFGEKILNRGQINRAKLAEIVFSNSRELKKLTEILHPKVRARINKQIQLASRNKRRKVIVLDVPLLFESGLSEICDINIVVKSGFAQQYQRLKKRLGLNSAQAAQRIRAQMPLKEKIRLSDIVIDNGKDLTKTKKQVEELWERLMQKKNVR